MVNINEFESHKLHKEYRVDYHKTNEHVQVDMVITLYNAPCSIVSIDYVDLMGQELHDIDTKKFPLTPDNMISDVRNSKISEFFSPILR